MNNYLPLALQCFLSLPAFAQTAPDIDWQRSLGSDANDYAHSIKQTDDDGYIMAGTVGGNSLDVTGFHGGFSDAWVVKLDAEGNIQWQRAIGGSGGEGVGEVLQTGDGGYIMAGSTYSNDGDVTGNHGTEDVWLVKLEPDGTLDWAKTYGGTNDDVADAIKQTVDGGYIIAGETRSNDGDVSGQHGGNDCWALKVSAVGDLEWQTCLGGTSYDAAYAVVQAGDGGYVLVGETGSDNGDVTGNHGGGSDYWVIKLDEAGTIEWQKALGGTGSDVAHSVGQTVDDGYIVAGETDSSDGDVTGYHGAGDFWVVKLDLDGTIQWQHAYGGSSLEVAMCIQPVSDGGYIVAGYTQSEDGQISGYHGGQVGDVWIVRIDSTGALLWQKAMGGSESDRAFDVNLCATGGYVLAGFSESSDGDLTANHGGRDCWVVKLGPDDVGIAEIQRSVSFALYPNPSMDAVYIQFEMPAAERVTLELFDAAGQLVGQPKVEMCHAGVHQVRYVVSDLLAGTYQLRLNIDGYIITRKLIKE